MTKKTTTFAARLAELIELDGLTLADIAAAGNVTVATARRWLGGHSQPLAGDLLQIADRLRVAACWLAGYSDLPPDEFRILIFHRSLPLQQQRQFETFVDLISRGDERARQLGDRLRAGEITRDQLLEEAGRIAP